MKIAQFQTWNHRPQAHANEAIEHIQMVASKLTLLKLQTKLSQTTQKLQNCRQQLKKLVTDEEWTDKQRADEEVIDSLTNKLDKFSDKLDNRRVRKLEKLQNPAADPNPPREKRTKRTHNDSNKGNKPNKVREGRVHRSPPRYRNERRDEPRERQRNTHQSNSGKERSPRASRNNIAPITYPPAQATSTYPLPYYINPIPAWPHPPMLSQMTPWVPDFPTNIKGITATGTIEGTPTTSTNLPKAKLRGRDP